MAGAITSSILCSVTGSAAGSKGRAGGTEALHHQQAAHLSVAARARVAHVGAVVLLRGTVDVEQALLSRDEHVQAIK